MSMDIGKLVGGYPGKKGEVVIPGLKVPKGKSLIAGSEEEVKMFGVKAVLEDADAGLCGVDLSPFFSGEFSRSASDVGVLRSMPIGDDLGDKLLWLLAQRPLLEVFGATGVRTRLPVEAELERSSGDLDFSLVSNLNWDLLSCFSFEESVLFLLGFS